MYRNVFHFTCALLTTIILQVSASAAVWLQDVGSISVGQSLGRIVADPVRDKVYGIAANGDVVFMDRTTLSIDKTISTGRKLTDIDVASDGSFMTVLDNVTREYWNQPPATYLIKYDLATQTHLGIKIIHSPLYHMALGRPNRIVGVAVNQWVNIYENDATSGIQLSTTFGGYAGSSDWENVTFATNPQGTRLYRTETGISSINVMAWDISTDTITSIGSRTVGSYGTEPIFINSNDSSLYVGDLRLNPANLQQVLSMFPETIYAATADNTLAFGANNIYDPTFGGILGSMPFSATKIAIGEYDHYLYAWDASTNCVHVFQIVPRIVPEPSTLCLLLAASFCVLFMRRRWVGIVASTNSCKLL